MVFVQEDNSTAITGNSLKKVILMRIDFFCEK
jgi:hypothetical protein